MRNQLPVPESKTTNNRLIDIGLVLVVVPVPQVKAIGVVSILAGFGLAFYDEIMQRR